MDLKELHLRGGRALVGVYGAFMEVHFDGRVPVGLRRLDIVLTINKLIGTLGLAKNNLL